MRLRLSVSMWGVMGALAIGAGAAACSSDMTVSDGGALYSPCAEGTQVGRFNLGVAASGADTGTAGFVGMVMDRPALSDFQRPVVSDGACTLMERDWGMPCTPACASDEVCYPDGTCAPTSIAHSVGTVTLTGLASGRSTFQPPTDGIGAIVYAASPGDLPYPPAAPGAAISLDTSGGDYAPFTLAGQGVTPLQARTGALSVARDQPLTIDWGAPSLPAATRLIAFVILGSDSPFPDAGTGYVMCNFPDTGTGTVPAALVNLLIDQGVGAAPSLSMQRATVSSTQITHGCVDFSVTTSTSQPIVVNP